MKLFRSTGHSSILTPGESRLATHPGWLVLAVSLWIGFVCNVALWRELRSFGNTSGLQWSLLAGALVAGACATLLSLLGWRRTLKYAATALLLIGALAASSIWVQGRPLDGDLLGQGLRSLLIPAWPSLLRWQFAAVFATLALPPMVWAWQLQVRRLPGPQQLKSNLGGMLLGVGVMALSGWLLLRP